MKGIKTLNMLSAVVLSFSLLAGCGGNASSTDKSTQAANSQFADPDLNIAVFQGGYGREYWDTIAEDFMKDYPGTKINITASPKIAELIRPKIVAGNPPDLMYIAGSDNTSLLDGLVKDHALLDLTDVFDSTPKGETQPLKNKILLGALESRAMAPYGDGKVYAAPFNFGVMGLWYNKTLFKQKGIEVPKTWDELLALNTTAQQNNRALFTYQGLYPGYLEEIIVPSIYSVSKQTGLTDFFDYNPAFWTSDTFRQVWGVLEKIATEDNGLMKGTVALNHTQAQTEFMQGHAMFIPNGTWFEDEMKDAPREEGFEFGFLGVPAFKKGDPVTAMTSVEQIVIPAKAKNPELAKAFLSYLYTDKSVKLNAEKSKGILAVKGAPDLVKEYISDTTYNVYKTVDSGMVAINGSFKSVAKGSKYNPSEEVYNPISSLMNKQMTLDQYSAQMTKLYTELNQELVNNTP
ncbi:N-acetylglucosamine transport system substrate-binding protein [Paenibacillus sp. SORGH_AS306]|uniref:carbohydrate ABC transporter substrate-binding protein n=1 Tax=unclassified Paenibacillus TaxID=185978 RepID=UPI0027887D98|nr:MULTISPECIES: carbohydrate ABC transporter substrate-binding protein [unclassified Paenibacillus]MDQ1236382.1 N-acetylglucosamine transport system substrate-binding protein [Paenibacillus sp. SORGH_AS_0306]MDR6108735.1 N-acetylglucosamine transport system substrate-binding protein [Paenibacillus sp. SORGH_AS_0338]